MNQDQRDALAARFERSPEQKTHAERKVAARPDAAEHRVMSPVAQAVRPAAYTYVELGYTKEEWAGLSKHRKLRAQSKAADARILRATGAAPKSFWQQFGANLQSQAAANRPKDKKVQSISEATEADAAAGFVSRRSTKARAGVVMTGVVPGLLFTRRHQAESIATGRKFKRGK